MIVKDLILMTVGKIRIMDDESGKLLQELDLSKETSLRPDLATREINYIGSNLRYFCNSKRAEYSAAINIYI